MRTIFGLLLLAMLPTSASAADICSAIKQVAEGKSDLSPLRGQEREDGSWDSTVQITEFQSCFLEPYDGKLIFKCQSLYDTAEPARAQVDSLSAVLWKCGSFATRMLTESRDTVSWSYWAENDAQFALEMSTIINSETFQLVPGVELRLFEE